MPREKLRPWLTDRIFFFLLINRGKNFGHVPLLISQTPTGKLPKTCYWGCCLLQNKNTNCLFIDEELQWNEEATYVQIEKEWLDICFACHEFHQLVYEYEILTFTDHKSLVTIKKKKNKKQNPSDKWYLCEFNNYRIIKIWATVCARKKKLLADPLSRLYYIGDVMSEKKKT